MLFWECRGKCSVGLTSEAECRTHFEERCQRPPGGVSSGSSVVEEDLGPAPRTRWLASEETLEMYRFVPDGTESHADCAPGRT